MGQIRDAEARLALRNLSSKAASQIVQCGRYLTPLYGCESWTSTKAEEQQLLRAERKMLRLVFGMPRRLVSQPDGTAPETWVDLIKRATATAEESMTAAGSESWVQQFRRQKWSWAGASCRSNDDKLFTKAMCWSPELKHGTMRSQGGPTMRWGGCLKLFMSQLSLTDDWHKLALDKRKRNSMEGAARFGLHNVRGCRGPSRLTLTWAGICRPGVGRCIRCPFQRPI